MTPKRLVDLRVNEISLVDQPANKGARVVLFKRDGTAEEQETRMEELVKKAIEADIADNEREAARKALVRKQVEDGVLSVQNVAAQMCVEALAREVQKREPGTSFEAAYCQVLEAPEHRDIVQDLY